MNRPYALFSPADGVRVDHSPKPSFEHAFGEAVELMRLIDGGEIVLNPRCFPVIVHEPDERSADTIGLESRTQ